MRQIFALEVGGRSQRFAVRDRVEQLGGQDTVQRNGCAAHAAGAAEFDLNDLGCRLAADGQSGFLAGSSLAQSGVTVAARSPSRIRNRTSAACGETLRTVPLSTSG